MKKSDPTLLHRIWNAVKPYAKSRRSWRFVGALTAIALTGLHLKHYFGEALASAVGGALASAMIGTTMFVICALVDFSGFIGHVADVLKGIARFFIWLHARCNRAKVAYEDMIKRFFGK